MDFLNKEVNTEQTNTENTPSINFNVGEKEYNAESAAKKILNADQHIENILEEKRLLVEELQQLKSQATQSTNLDQALDNMRTQAQTSDSVAPQQLDLGSLKNELLSEIRTEQQKAQEVQKAEQQKTKQESNYSLVSEELVKLYGDNTNTIVSDKAKEMDMEAEEVNTLARTNPKAFLKLFGRNKAQQATHVTSNQNSTAYEMIVNNRANPAQDLAKKILSSTKYERDAYKELEKQVLSSFSQEDLRNKWSR